MDSIRVWALVGIWKKIHYEIRTLREGDLGTYEEILALNVEVGCNFENRLHVAYVKITPIEIVFTDNPCPKTEFKCTRNRF